MEVVRVDVVRVVEQTKKYGTDGSITLVTKLSCGCLIVRTATLLGNIEKPLWFRCERHRNAKPEEISVEVET
jgi:hypothetical protein